jgi:hypothetical protein
MTKIAQLQREHEQDSAVPERNDERLTRVARATAKVGADVARESVRPAQGATDAAEDLYEATRKSAEESTEIGQVFVELLGEQTRQSVEALSAFTRTVNWTEVAQAQSKLIAGSLLRISQFNARYGDLLLRGMTAIPTLPRR